MSYRYIEIREHNVAFSLPATSTGRAQSLRLLPVAYLQYYDNADYTDNLLEAKIELICVGHAVDYHDFFGVDSLEELYNALSGPNRLGEATASLGGSEGLFSLEVTWREVENDFHFLGRLPMPDFYYLKMERDPYYLRHAIRSVTEFEFCLELDALSETATALGALLDHIRSL
jgi:hypothetical protein